MWSPRAAFKKRKKRRWNSIRGDACTIQIIHTGEKHHSVLISHSVFCSSFLEMRVLVVYSQKWSRKPAFLEGLSAEMSLLLCESSMPVNGLLWWSVWHPCATLLSGIVPPAFFDITSPPCTICCVLLANFILSFYLRNIQCVRYFDRHKRVISISLHINRDKFFLIHFAVFPHPVNSLLGVKHKSQIISLGTPLAYNSAPSLKQHLDYEALPTALNFIKWQETKLIQQSAWGFDALLDESWGREEKGYRESWESQYSILQHHIRKIVSRKDKALETIFLYMYKKCDLNKRKAECQDA